MEESHEALLQIIGKSGGNVLTFFQIPKYLSEIDEKLAKRLDFLINAAAHNKEDVTEVCEQIIKNFVESPNLDGVDLSSVLKVLKVAYPHCSAESRRGVQTWCCSQMENFENVTQRPGWMAPEYSWDGG